MTARFIGAAANHVSSSSSVGRRVWYFPPRDRGHLAVAGQPGDAWPWPWDRNHAEAEREQATSGVDHRVAARALALAV